MSQHIKTVLVLGATGSIGPYIVGALLSAGFQVSAMTRNAAKAKFDSKVQVIESDYSPDSLVKAFAGQDAIISAIATAITSEQIKIIDAAIQAGVKRFLPSEYGIDSSSEEVTVRLPPIKTKRDTVQYLQKRYDEGSGLSWTAVIVGGFFDWAFQFPGLMGWNLQKREVVVFDGGNVEYEVTNVGQIGRAVAALLAAEHQKETANTYVYVNSFTVTQNQILDTLRKVTGEKWQVVEAKRKDWYESGVEKMKKRVFVEIGGAKYLDGAGEVITAEILNNGGFNNWSESKGLWNDRLGLPKEDLEETIRGIIDAAA